MVAFVHRHVMTTGLKLPSVGLRRLADDRHPVVVPAVGVPSAARTAAAAAAAAAVRRQRVVGSPLGEDLLVALVAQDRLHDPEPRRLGILIEVAPHEPIALIEAFKEVRPPLTLFGVGKIEHDGRLLLRGQRRQEGVCRRDDRGRGVLGRSGGRG